MEIADTFRTIVRAETVQTALDRSKRHYRQDFIQGTESAGNEPADQPAGIRHFPADRRIFHYRARLLARKSAGRAALLGPGA